MPLLKILFYFFCRIRTVYIGDQFGVKEFSTAWDDRGNVGKRYYSQDEIGTPYCVTVDFQTLEDKMVTVRDRDTMKQERVAINDLSAYLKNAIQ